MHTQPKPQSPAQPPVNQVTQVELPENLYAYEIPIQQNGDGRPNYSPVNVKKKKN